MDWFEKESSQNIEDVRRCPIHINFVWFFFFFVVFWWEFTTIINGKVWELLVTKFGYVSDHWRLKNVVIE